MTDLPKPRVIDRIVGPSPRESAMERELAEIHAAFNIIADKHENLEIDLLSGERASVSEGLANVDLMLDSQGWTSIFEYEADEGLTLRQVKEASRQIRELLVGNPFIQNGARIRTASVWAGGIEFSCRNKTDQKIKPLPSTMQEIIYSVWAQRYIFGNRAHGELERAAFSDGTLFFLGRDSDRRVQRVQLQEITGMLANPNNSEEVLAYRRTWNPDPQGNGTEPRTRWYYTDAVPASERKRTVQVRGGQTETAEVGYTMIDIGFNKQVGWALGVPDALCVVAWARLYKEFLVNGYVMSRSLARLAYKLTVANKASGDNASTTIAKPGQAGSTYVEGEGNTLTAMSTAGKGYDFASGNSLAGSIAAGLGVSLLALLSNPAAATGSNAAAQTLDPIAKATAAVRRNEWEDDFVRIFRYLGLDKPLVILWHDLPEDTIQRQGQTWQGAAASGLFGPEKMQAGLAKVLGIADPGPIPDGYLIAQNSHSLALKDIDTDGVTPSAGSGQGTDNPAGKQPNDHSDDPKPS